MSTTELSLNESKEYIINNIKYQQESIKQNKPASCIYISGPPGCGKSSIIEQIAIDLGYGLNIQYLATLLLEAFGMPLPTMDPNAIFQRWSSPEFYSIQNLKIEPKLRDKWIILFLDDIHLAPKNIQNYLFQLILCRSIHNKKLPDNFIIILAGNRSIDRAGYQSLMSPIVNRLQMLDIKSSAQDWLVNFAIPQNLRQDIISFIELYPNLLISEPLESKAFASPRSWVYYSDSLKELEKIKHLTTSDYLILGTGYIGSDYTSKFIEYVQLYMKWNSKAYLNGEPLPLDLSMSKIDNYTLMASLIAEFMKNVKNCDYDVNNSLIAKQLEVVKKLFNHLIANCREIIPLGLRTIVVSESNKSKQALLYYKLIEKNDVLLEAAKKLLNINSKK